MLVQHRCLRHATGGQTLPKPHCRLRCAKAQQAGPATGDPTALAMAWDSLGVVHSGLGEYRQAIGCYRQALALVHELKTPLARALMIIMLTEHGDACQATGDLSAAVEAWQQALQVLDDLGWPDLAGLHAKIEQASPPGSRLPGGPPRRESGPNGVGVLARA